jgi:hypothetical protein
MQEGRKKFRCGNWGDEKEKERKRKKKKEKKKKTGHQSATVTSLCTRSISSKRVCQDNYNNIKKGYH